MSMKMKTISDIIYTNTTKEDCKCNMVCNELGIEFLVLGKDSRNK